MQALNLLHNEQLLNECRRQKDRKRKGRERAKDEKNPSVTDERPDGKASIPFHHI